MKRISIRQLHEHTGKLVREPPSGGYVVTDRGQPVARIVPLDEAPSGPPFSARVLRPALARMKPIRWDSTKAVRDDRDRR